MNRPMLAIAVSALALCCLTFTACRTRPLGQYGVVTGDYQLSPVLPVLAPRVAFYATPLTPTGGELAATMDHQIPRLARLADLHRSTGPVLIRYRGNDLAPLPQADTQIGFTVPVGEFPNHDFTLAILADFPCVAMQFTGPIDERPAAYEHIAQYLQEKGLQASGEVRELYLRFTTAESPDNQIEIQVGIHLPKERVGM